MAEKRYLTTADVAALIGVDSATVRSYRAMSKPGRRYGKHPFPQPDDFIARAPIWYPERSDEIKQWDVTRPGPGRPQKSEARRADVDDFPGGE